MTMQTGEPLPGRAVIPGASTTHASATPQTYTFLPTVVDQSPKDTLAPDTLAELGYDASIAPPSGSS
jgi:hypothetical protein